MTTASVANFSHIWRESIWNTRISWRGITYRSLQYNSVIWTFCRVGITVVSISNDEFLNSNEYRSFRIEVTFIRFLVLFLFQILWWMMMSSDTIYGSKASVFCVTFGIFVLTVVGILWTYGKEKGLFPHKVFYRFTFKIQFGEVIAIFTLLKMIIFAAIS